MYTLLKFLHYVTYEFGYRKRSFCLRFSFPSVLNLSSLGFLSLDKLLLVFNGPVGGFPLPKSLPFPEARSKKIS